MILNHTIEPWEHDPEQLVHTWTLALDMGHASYGPNKATLDRIKPALFFEDDPDPEWVSSNGEVHINALLTMFPDHADAIKERLYGFGTWVLFEAHHDQLMEAFRETAASLLPSLDPSGYTPGGDDDFFDYHPSGMEFFKALAEDLTTIFTREGMGDFYKDPGFIGVYRYVLRDLIRREKLRNPEVDRPGEITEDYVKQEAEYANTTPEEVWNAC